MNLKILADNRGLKAPNVGVDFKALKEQGYHPSPPSIPVSNSSVERNFTPSIVESFQTASKSRYGVELQQGHQSNFNSVGHNDLEQTLRAISDREESTASRHSLTVMTDNTDIYGAAAGQVSIPGDREQTTNSESKQLSLGTLLRDEMVNQILNQPASFFRLSNFTKSLGNYLLQVAREEDISKDKEIFAEQLLAMKPFHAQLVLDSFSTASQAILRDEMRTQIINQRSIVPAILRGQDGLKEMGLNLALRIPGATSAAESISRKKDVFAKLLLEMKPFHAQVILDSLAQHTTIEVHTEVYTNVGGQSNPPLASEGK